MGVIGQDRGRHGRGIGDRAGVVGRAVARGLVGGARGTPQGCVAGDAAQCKGRTLVAPTDVGDPAFGEGALRENEGTFGRLDLLFNNAGTGAPAVPLEDLSVEQWKTVVDANLNGVFYCTQEAFKIMKSQTPPRRPHHQQRLDLRARAAPELAPYTSTSTR